MATRPPKPPAKPRAAPARPKKTAARAPLLSGPWRRRVLAIGGVLAVILIALTAYAWNRVASEIDRRLGGGDDRPMPRIWSRPVEITPGQPLSITELRARLNDVAYSEQPKAEHPGEFAVNGSTVSIVTRGSNSVTARVEIGKGNYVTRIVPPRGAALDHITLEPALLAALASGERRRYVPISAIPDRVKHAVLAIEDRRFYDHPGVDPIGIVGALWRDLRGDNEYMAGGSTITQQIVKNTFLTPQKTLKRKLSEQFIAIVMETRLSKDQILELYLNEVNMGQRGPFAIRGVAETSRVFFGVDLQNVSLAQAALMAGVVQSPSRLSPFRNPERALERRNLVLAAMVEAGYITDAEKKKAAAEPLGVAAHAMENAAPYFVDWVSDVVDRDYKGLLTPTANVDVYTSLDVQMQRMAQDAMSEGIALIDKQLAARKRKGIAQAAMVVANPRTGEILAMIGGRGYSQSQYNRAVLAKRQPGSTFKPFVYLAAFEKMAETFGRELTPATVMIDEPTTWVDANGNPYTPSNYQNEYDGPVTLRNALAHSRNIVAIKTAEATGYDRVADLWRRIGEGARALPVPSIALGVFEASPLEMATAYTLFTNGGAVRPLKPILRIVENGREKRLTTESLRQVARPETTYLVVDMMRGVLNEGTAAAARSQGFRLDAAGKTGTTNDQRDAWFIGFTPDLLAVVWVGFDDNAPLYLTGSQAALPIWTSFMKKATAGLGNRQFTVPDGVSFADICRESGYLASGACPRVVRMSFLPGSEPTEVCPFHR